jgi:hypothetical protein
VITIVEVSDEEPRPVVRMQDDILHTVEQPECNDPCCICHEEEAVLLFLEFARAVVQETE